MAALVSAAVGLLIAAGVYCWYAAALAAVFAKMGAPKWKAWVPVVSQMEVLERTGRPAWHVVFVLFVPVYGLVVWVLALHRVNQSFGRGTGYTVLAVVLMPVWASLLGWGADQPDFEPQRMSQAMAPSIGRGPLAAPESVPMWGGAPAAAPAPPSAQPWAPGDPYGQAVAAPGALPPVLQTPVAPGQPVVPGQPAGYSQPGGYGQPGGYSQPGGFGQPAGFDQPGAFGQPVVPGQPGGFGQTVVPGQPWLQEPAPWPQPSAPTSGAPSGQGFASAPAPVDPASYAPQPVDLSPLPPAQPFVPVPDPAPGLPSYAPQPVDLSFGQPVPAQQFPPLLDAVPGPASYAAQPVDPSFGQPLPVTPAHPYAPQPVDLSFGQPLPVAPAQPYAPQPVDLVSFGQPVPAPGSAVPAPGPFDVPPVPVPDPRFAAPAPAVPVLPVALAADPVVPPEPAPATSPTGAAPVPSLPADVPAPVVGLPPGAVVVPDLSSGPPGPVPLELVSADAAPSGQVVPDLAPLGLVPQDAVPSGPVPSAPAAWGVSPVQPAAPLAVASAAALAPVPEPVAPATSLPAVSDSPPPTPLTLVRSSDAQATMVIQPDDDVEGTVVVRRPTFQPWVLSLDDGRTFVIRSRSVVLGRRPESVDLGVQVLTITDDGRTISKTHARLDLVDGTWRVTDLGSTNGVVTTDADGEEIDVERGKPMPVYGRLVLGAVGMRLTPGESA